MTNSVRKRDSSVMMSSVMPSLKYRCSGIAAQVERTGARRSRAWAAASAACPAAGSLSGAAIGAAWRWRMRSYSAVVAGSGCTPISAVEPLAQAVVEAERLNGLAPPRNEPA